MISSRRSLRARIKADRKRAESATAERNSCAIICSSLSPPRQWNTLAHSATHSFAFPQLALRRENETLIPMIGAPAMFYSRIKTGKLRARGEGGSLVKHIAPRSSNIPAAMFNMFTERALVSRPVNRRILSPLAQSRGFTRRWKLASYLFLLLVSFFSSQRLNEMIYTINRSCSRHGTALPWDFDHSISRSGCINQPGV